MNDWYDDQPTGFFVSYWWPRLMVPEPGRFAGSSRTESPLSYARYVRTWSSS
jgi:hypothetical protein